MKKIVILQPYLLNNQFLNNMKKTFLLLLAVLSLLSCGNSKKDNKNTENTQQEQQEITIEKESIVKSLDYKKFLKEIWDIEKYPDSFAYKAELPCIIDFYADWCGPCKRVAPIMEEIAKEYEGKLLVYKVNTDNERKLSTIFRISSIPTVFFMPKDGQPKTQVGALSKTEYKNIIDQYLVNQ